MPLSGADRLLIQEPKIVEPAKATWPEDSLAVEGIWIGAGPLQLRPIFPGSMRFIADDLVTIPTIGPADIQDGKLTQQCLARLSGVQGTLLVRIQNSDALSKMNSVGALKALGAAPTHAYYSSVQLSEEFFRQSLLNFASGLIPATVQLATGPVMPGAPEWEKLVAAGFLAGDYEPVIRAAEDINHDQAEVLPMPHVTLSAGGAFSLKIALGWVRDRSSVPAPENLKAAFEPVPVRAFFQHVAKSLREPVLAADGADALTVSLLAEQDSSTAWHLAMRTALQSIGFGSVSGDSPINDIIREFQIIASGGFAASSKLPTISNQQLELRDFNDLKQAANVTPYIGPVSGRANFQTRKLIDLWQRGGLRNPLIIVAFDKGDVESDALPAIGAKAAVADIWLRDEVNDRNKRMFAADFRSATAGGGIDNKTLQPVGYFGPYKGFGGPASLEPTSATRISFAEVTPERLFDGVSRDLIDALSGVNPDKALLANASTFRVIRAVSEEECRGYLDQINAYDSAGISTGLCHFSMADSRSKPEGGTELGGLAAFCRYLESTGAIPEADVFRPQGLSAKVLPPYLAKHPAGTSIGGVYYSALCFLDDRGDARAMTGVSDIDYMGSWRSAVRWIHLGQRSRSFGLVNWLAALRRLARICDTPIAMAAYPPDSRQLPGRVRTIGSVFTSEVLIAWLLRWHVKMPIGVVTTENNKGKASEYIADAYLQAASYSPQTEDEWEIQLRAQILITLKRFQTKYPHNDELTKNFENIEKPGWAAAPPLPVGSNPRAYGLDPRLRRCSIAANSFYLAPSIADPDLSVMSRSPPASV